MSEMTAIPTRYETDFCPEARMHPVTARAKTIGAHRIAGTIRIVRKDEGQSWYRLFAPGALGQRDLIARTLWLLRDSVERINETWLAACLRDKK